MKNNLFGRTTALVIGSLVVFSVQAVAFSSHNQVFIAQGSNGCDENLEPGVGVGVAVSVAVKAFDQSIAVVRTVSVSETFPPEAKEAVIAALEEVSRTLGEALTFAEADDNVAVATAVSKAISVGTGQAQVVAAADAGAAQAITEANACASQAQTIAAAQTGETN